MELELVAENQAIADGKKRTRTVLVLAQDLHIAIQKADRLEPEAAHSGVSCLQLAKMPPRRQTGSLSSLSATADCHSKNQLTAKSLCVYFLEFASAALLTSLLLRPRSAFLVASHLSALAPIRPGPLVA
jgi:hypothetical protein